ncbi:hypothetical protein [Sphingomonas sp. 2378]
MRNVNTPDQAYADALAGLLLCAGDVLRTAQDVAAIRKHEDLSGRIETLRLDLLELTGSRVSGAAVIHQAKAKRDHIAERVGLALGHMADAAGGRELARSSVRDEVFANFIRQRIDRISRAAAHMLLRMLDQPDRFMDHQALAQAARVGTHTPTVRVVKVYICNIRAGLAEHGIENAIETGWKSYAITSAKARAILDFLHQLKDATSDQPETS